MKNLAIGILWSLVGLTFLFVTFDTTEVKNRKSVDAAEIIEPLHFSSRSSAVIEPETSVNDINAMGQKLAFAHRLLHEFWSDTFRSRGWRYTAPGLVPYNSQFGTPCGPTIPNNAFYCRGDHTIYFDVNFFANEMARAGRSLGTDGDTAPIVILSHEWGHAVQGMLGVDNESIEYQADCFAGSFIQFSIGKGVVENGDIEEASFSLFNAGDARWSYRHGTNQERVNNFLTGLRGGVTACGIR